MPTQLHTIYEDPNEEWADNEVHRHYNMPMVAVRAKPRIQMRCNVYRDNASLLKVKLSIDKWVNAEYFIWEMSAGLANSGVSPQWTELFEEKYKEKWVQVQNEFEGIADLPERFLHQVPAPPFQVAEVRIKTKEHSCYWRLRANTGRHMVDTSFWYLWKLILQQNSPTVGTFDVILRAPSHTPAGEDPIAPWDVPLSVGSHIGVISREDVSYLGCEGARNNLARLDFTCLRQGAQRDSISPARRGRSRSTSATMNRPQCRRDRCFYD
ncbi:hypothetical protein N7491_007432 [Penicillium cf. griseofulvum]|uniref:Uncharacterized protein n=1 Tax=Penicillium cf. griseofulvum TaxID=2972120 RepID=A0A9W9IVC6_9EURO|nr:hypothetical protein N7472_009539 [Penicillium cf. griseofulvum]KAJ5430416.1 hypothetical protein N7491_007432 [Penicillium cf. griseofulvum]KAJ5435814.1 hypothetical protein N7445_006699 [Penicillium cf. griseofulvum]